MGVLWVTGSHTTIVCSISGRKEEGERGIVGNCNPYVHRLLHFREEGGSGRGCLGNRKPYVRRLLYFREEGEGEGKGVLSVTGSRLDRC